MASGFNTIQDVSVTGLVSIEADTIASGVVVAEALIVDGENIFDIIDQIENEIDTNAQNIAQLQLDMLTKAGLTSNNTFTGVNTFTSNVDFQASITVGTNINNVPASFYDPTSSIQTQINSKTSLAAIQSNNNVWTGTNAFTNSLPTSNFTPSSNSQLANKAYVDTQVNTRTTLAAVQANANVWTNTNQFNTVLPSSNITPTNITHFCNKNYVDNKFVALLGTNNSWDGTNTFNARPKCSLAPSAGVDLCNKTYVDTAASTAAQNVFKVKPMMYTTSQVITPPTGTVKMDVFVYGSGGLGGDGIMVYFAPPLSSYYQFGGSGAGGNMLSASNISWNDQTTLTLSVTPGNGNYTQLGWMTSGAVYVRAYNGGSAPTATVGGGAKGVKNTTGSTTVPSVADWMTYFGMDGEDGGTNQTYPPTTPYVPTNTAGNVIKGGSIMSTVQQPGMIGAGQSWGTGTQGGGYTPSAYTPGGCMIFWYII